MHLSVVCYKRDPSNLRFRDAPVDVLSVKAGGRVVGPRNKLETRQSSRRLQDNMRRHGRTLDSGQSGCNYATAARFHARY
jgi:hypothetical protein